MKNLLLKPNVVSIMERSSPGLKKSEVFSHFFMLKLQIFSVPKPRAKENAKTQRVRNEFINRQATTR